MSFKAVVIDDHEIVRKGIVRILSESPKLSVAADFADGNSALNWLERERADVVLLDISMPGRGGVDILKEIKTRWPDLPVLMLTVHPVEQYAVRALKAGASGYMTKNCVQSELTTAVISVARGGRYITPELAERMAIEISQPSEGLPHESLSDREYQVLVMIASGKTVKNISEELNLSAKTISTYRTRILEKMGMRNNAELTYYAIKAGLVD